MKVAGVLRPQPRCTLIRRTGSKRIGPECDGCLAVRKKANLTSIADGGRLSIKRFVHDELRPSAIGMSPEHPCRPGLIGFDCANPPQARQ